MLRRAAWVGLLGALAAGCSDTMTLYDVWDAGLPNQDSGPSGGREDRPRGLASDGGCFTQQRHSTFYPQSRLVMIVLDRSSAMQGAFSGGSGSKAASAQNLLTSDILPTYQSLMQFGLELVPGNGEFRSSNCSHGGCCVDSPPTVPAGANALDLIKSSLQCSDQQPCPATGDAPWHQALSAVRDYYYALWSSKSSWGWGVTQPGFVLLVTASEPSCAVEGTNDLCSAALNAATDLGKLDVPVVVYSMGFPVDSNSRSCLAKLSSVGSVTQQLPGGAAKLNVVNSTSALKDNMTALLNAIAAMRCTLTMNESIGDGVSLAVTVGSTSIKQDGPDGWSFDNSAGHSTIKLSGTACQMYVASPQLTVSAAYSCVNCAGAPNSCYASSYP
jgi:hypothetical protein